MIIITLKTSDKLYLICNGKELEFSSIMGYGMFFSSNKYRCKIRTNVSIPNFKYIDIIKSKDISIIPQYGIFTKLWIDNKKEQVLFKYEDYPCDPYFEYEDINSIFRCINISDMGVLFFRYWNGEDYVKYPTYNPYNIHITGYECE